MDAGQHQQDQDGGCSGDPRHLPGGRPFAGGAGRRPLGPALDLTSGSRSPPSLTGEARKVLKDCRIRDDAIFDDLTIAHAIDAVGLKRAAGTRRTPGPTTNWKVTARCLLLASAA